MEISTTHLMFSQQLHRGANVDPCGSYVGIIFLHNTLWVSSMSKLLPSSVSFFSELLITHRFIHIKLNNEAKQNSNLVQLSGSPRGSTWKKTMFLWESVFSD